MNSVCRRRSVGSKRAPKSSVRSVNSVREKTFHEWISALKTSVTSVFSVRDKPPQRISSVLSHMEGAFYLSQIYTEEQNTQIFTETLSQPISQNVTATFSYNVLWYLYAGGLLWDRNSAQKGSVKSVSSVRERNVLRERITSPQVLHTCALWEKNLPMISLQCSFSHREHRWTEHTAFHRDIKSTDITERYS